MRNINKKTFKKKEITMEKLINDYEIEDFENCAVCGYCCGEKREYLVKTELI
ncbi:MAG: hypothetical protein QG558_1497 [Campylobacterota bacterium]|nr:hypothetical protein [Campylobacterota bacterium]